MSFLQQKDVVTADPATHKELLKTLWFGMYSRGQGKISSSGFEHVFLSEVKNGTVLGLHNWIYLAEEESARDLDYKGWLKKIDLGNVGTFTHSKCVPSHSHAFIFLVSEGTNCKSSFLLERHKQAVEFAFHWNIART